MLLNDLLNTYNKVKTERTEQNVWKSTAGPMQCMERFIAESVEWKFHFKVFIAFKSL